MLSKALGTDIYHLWACKVLFFGVPRLLLSQLSSIISQSSADSKVTTQEKEPEVNTFIRTLRRHGC